ncbi:23S rRNA (uracil-5-)-methyltransferase RumA [Candidatus Atribacteria bacterium RBG_19FT_COMBO_35_14]|uniref:23S rRNA (Uracil-5-)-methyltransferase RumA n=1 Tax=Candidatus Sediminicultor quintus TaxID=1797291 RepID=A0A1F5AA26_9BACT|nr:MAG: 23S rRNA (uracil-5-)-methyltransferase RumA [Candidatus Atribacteria bacterium RBG_19FT_COMBO_35_14]
MKDKPVHLEEDYEFLVNGYSHQGEGIGRMDNFTIFVPGVISGERVRVKISEAKKNFARGRLEEIILSSPFRVEPRCPVYNFCGGCQLQHIVYEKQLEMKKEIVENALGRIGKQNIKVLPTIGMKDPWRYRNKGYFQVNQEKGRIRLGFYKAGSYDFVPAAECVLFSMQINRLVSYLEDQLSLQKVTVYHSKTGGGNLRNVLIRESRSRGEIMIVFFTKEDNLGFDQNFLNDLAKTFPQVVSVYQNINRNPKAVLLGKDFRLLKGEPDLEDALGPFRFKISPQSFFQVNVAQAEILNEKVLEYANLSGEEIVIDSYCGTAAISIYVAKQAEKVYGIEVEKSAARDAIINCELNGISNLKLFTGKVEGWLYKWRRSGEEVHLMIVDPPRRGCSLKALQGIIKIKPRKIIYVSCHPATLARDLKYLTKDGDYKLKKVLPIDMFPQTSHIECLAYLKR